MDSGIIVYPRTISIDIVYNLFFEKIVKGPNFAIYEDISNVKSGEDLSYVNMYIFASWGTTAGQLAQVLNWYPTLKLYKLSDVNDNLTVCVCQHNEGQLHTCLAKYSHAKQLVSGNLPQNKVIDGFRVNNINQFNQGSKGLYASVNIPNEVNDVEHLHMIGSINLIKLHQWLDKIYARTSQTMGKNEKIIVHLYGNSSDHLIDQINILDHVYNTMILKSTNIS